MHGLLFEKSHPPANVRVSAFDRVSSALWALIVVVGILALLSGLLWMQKQWTAMAIPSNSDSQFDRIRYLPIEPIANEKEDAGAIEFSDENIPKLAETIRAMTEDLSRLRYQIADLEGQNKESVPGRSGDPSPVPIVNQRANHWSIEFEADAFKDYVAVLARFGIEIGFVDKEIDQVEIVYDMATSPKIRPTTKAAERRVYFVHAESKLRSWDLRLARNAGIQPDGKIMVQFYPDDTTQALARLEAAEADRLGLELDAIERTTFRVRQAGDAHEFFVAEIVPKR